jgi:hypothetical protein
MNQATTIPAGELMTLGKGAAGERRGRSGGVYADEATSG